MTASVFPTALKFSRLQHGAQVLMHLRGMPELNLGHIGETMLPVLSAYRQILPDFVNDFYELIYPIIVLLNKYCDLAESCSKSGAYNDRRQEALNNLLAAIVTMEKDDQIMKILVSMQRR